MITLVALLDQGFLFTFGSVFVYIPPIRLVICTTHILAGARASPPPPIPMPPATNHPPKTKQNPPTRNEASRRTRNEWHQTSLGPAGHATNVYAIYEIAFLGDIAMAVVCYSACHFANSSHSSHASMLAPSSSPLLQQILEFSSSAPIQISLFPIKKKGTEASRQLL